MVRVAIKKKLKSVAPLSIPKYLNKVSKMAWPTPNPAGERGIAVVIIPRGIKLKAEENVI